MPRKLTLQSTPLEGYHPLLQPMLHTVDSLINQAHPRAWDVLHVLVLLNGKPTFNHAARADRAGEGGE